MKSNNRVWKFFANLGPGLITGAADDDPAGISTYSVAGAAFGYAALWTALFSVPLMSPVQLMAARDGFGARTRRSRAPPLLALGSLGNVRSAGGRQRHQHRRRPWWNGRG